MERFQETALVLSTVDYGESDRVVTLLTATRGKLSAFAAGARKSKRRFAGALEPFTLLNAQLVERQGTTYRLDSVDIQRGFYSVRSDLARIARALYVVELARELVRDREPNPQLYAQVLEYLELLEQNRAGPTSLLDFELRALAITGLMPRFDRCSVCSQEWGRAPRFDPAQGGGICEQCRPRSPFSLAVPVEVLSSLRGLQNGERIPLAPEIRQRSRELLNVFIAHHLGRKLKSVDFMNQVGLD